MTQDKNIERRLIDSGVIEVLDNDEITVTSEFINEIEDWQDDLSETVEESLLNDLVTPDHDLKLYDFLDRDSMNDLLRAYYLSLVSLNSFTHDECLRIMPLIDMLNQPSVEYSGSPDPFITVRSKNIQFFTEIYEKSVVYFRKEDCPPCDRMRERLGTVFEDPPDDIGIFSVYGPEDPKLIYDRYSVNSGPTTLFMLNGSVDARLHGAKKIEIIETEVEKLRRSHSLSKQA